MKRILVLLVAVVTVFTLAACSKGTTELGTIQEGKLVVGMEVDYPPFNWQETTKTDYNWPVDGQEYFAAGYDVSIAMSIADSLKLELVIKEIEWDSLLPALQTNQIDLIIAGMSPNETRKEIIDFTDSYYSTNHVVIAKEGNSVVNINNLDGLNGAKGQGQVGTIYADLVDRMAIEHGAVVNQDNHQDSVPRIVNLLVNGTIDFSIVEKPVALGITAANPSIVIALDGDNMFDLPAEDREVAIGLRKESDNLRNQINEALASISTETRNQWMQEAIGRQ